MYAKYSNYEKNFSENIFKLKNQKQFQFQYIHFRQRCRLNSNIRFWDKFPVK
jgi:hypothetical protein